MVEELQLQQINFVEKIIPRETQKVNDLYLGMGFVGVNNNVSHGFGIDFLFFLLMAKKIGEALQSKEKTIFVMDEPYQKGIIIPNVEEKISLIEETLNFLQMDWKIQRFSKFGDFKLKNKTYEELQSEVTSELLCDGGFQIGWMYPPSNSSGRKDELYFAEQFKKRFPQRKDIGFILGLFPGIIPKYTPGPPYIVKNQKNRITMIDLDLKQKFFGLKKIKSGTAKKIFESLRGAGIEDNNSPSTIERFISSMNYVEKKIGYSYKKAFPNE